MEQFLSALEIEIVKRAEDYSARETVETIFFGGGTPSLLSPKQLERIFSFLFKHFRIEAHAEITCESNPGTVEQQKLNDFRSVGFNRISFGIQSFFEDDLKFLTRIHSATEAERAVENAYRAGFTNVNVDLIFALPKQTPQRWKENLRRAMALQPKHISAYALIVEENTPLAAMVKNSIVAPLPPEEDAALYEITIETLCASGYQQYEVSNFALQGFECRHNINYWNHANYLGFGPSAHSFWKDSTTTGKRWWNARSVQRYCETLMREESPVAGSEIIDRQKFFHEEIFLGLRSGGLNTAKLEQLFGAAIFDSKKNLLHAIMQEGLARQRNGLITLTPKGYALCDEISGTLISSAA